MKQEHNLFSTGSSKPRPSAELKRLKTRIANFRQDCTKEYFTLSLGQKELLDKIEKYLNS